MEHLQTLLKPIEPGSSEVEIDGILVSPEEHSLAKFDLEVLRPPYINKHMEGISKAHNFALRYFLWFKASEPKL
jgi:hypothetical protein